VGGCGWSGFTGRVCEGEGQDERERESKCSHWGRAPINSWGILRDVGYGTGGDAGAVTGTAVACFSVMSLGDWGVVDFGFPSRRVFWARENGAGIRGAHPLQEAQRMGHPQSKS